MNYKTGVVCVPNGHELRTIL